MKDLRQVPKGLELAKYWERPRLVRSVPSNGPDVSFNVFQTWSNLAAVSDVLARWQLFRGDPVITVSVTGSSALIGKWRVSATPRAIPSLMTPSVLPVLAFPEFCQSSQLPHVDIDFSLAETYVLKLPFPRATRYIDPSGDDYQVCLSEINPLITSNGTTTPVITMDVWVSYENVELNSIVNQGAEAPAGTVSLALDYAARISSYLPFAWATPATHALKLGASVAKFLGFARPPVEPQNTTVARHGANPALASGQPDFSYSVGTDPSVSRTIDEGVIPLSVPGDSTIDSIVSRWGQVRAGWNGSALHVHPGVCATATGPAYSLTPLAFAACQFRYWTGSLQLCVEIISSPLVRWRVGVVIIPPGAPVPAVFPKEGEYMTTIIEVAGSTCTEIEVPYLHLAPFLVTDLDFMSPAIAGQTRVVYFSLTSPTGPAETPVFPYVNLYIRGDSSLAFGVPSVSALDNFKVQGLDNDSVGMLGIGKQSMAVFGEVVDDLLVLTRRSERYGFEADFTNSPSYFSFPVVPRVRNEFPQEGVFSSLWWTHATFLPTAFWGNTGGYVHRIYCPKTTGYYITSALDTTGVPDIRRADGDGMVYMTPANNPTFEIHVPDRNPEMFRSGIPIAENAPQFTEVIILEGDMTEPVEPLGRWQFAVSGADDFRVGGFLAAPVLETIL